MLGDCVQFTLCETFVSFMVYVCICKHTHTGILGNVSVHGHASVCIYNLCL